MPSPYPMYLSPAVPVSNPVSTGHKVGMVVGGAVIGAVGFFVGRRMAKADPNASGPQQNP